LVSAAIATFAKKTFEMISTEIHMFSHFGSAEALPPLSPSAIVGAELAPPGPNDGEELELGLQSKMGRASPAPTKVVLGDNCSRFVFDGGLDFFAGHGGGFYKM
jgi:hypothetical protein